MISITINKQKKVKPLLAGVRGVKEAPSSGEGKRRLRLALSVLLALALWQAGAALFSRHMGMGGFLIAAPGAVLRRLAALLAEAGFWQRVWFSFIRILLGFLSALIAGSLTAAASGRFPLLETLLWPYITVIKSTPVASFIILCLILAGSKNLSAVISFLMVLPIIYSNMLEGIRSADRLLLEMAEIFKAGWGRQVLYIYLPHLKPYLISACSVSLGMTWKSGIAAEVIGIPGGSIGEMLYEAKVYLNARDLFAWTAVIIVISALFEKAFMALLKKAYSRLEAMGGGAYDEADLCAGMCVDHHSSLAGADCAWAGSSAEGADFAGSIHAAASAEAAEIAGGGKAERPAGAAAPAVGAGSAGAATSTVAADSAEAAGIADDGKAARPAGADAPTAGAGSAGAAVHRGDIAIQGLYKSYGDKPVLADFSAVFPAGQCTCIMGDSGVGKTTLFRILLGLTPADAGSVKGLEGLKPSAVFQEDRLCDSLNAVANIGFACGKEAGRIQIISQLTALGLKESLFQPVRELSGGMRRRVAIIRAVLASSDYLVLDEPFKGLDEQNREAVAAYIRVHAKGKTILMVTHSHEEVDLMDGRLLYISQ